MRESRASAKRERERDHLERHPDEADGVGPAVDRPDLHGPPFPFPLLELPFAVVVAARAAAAALALALLGGEAPHFRWQKGGVSE